MDDETKTISTADDNSDSDSSTEDTNLLEVEESDVQPEKTEQSTEDTKTEGKVNGAQKRIHKLVDERDQAKQEAEDLRSKLAELTAPTNAVYPQQQQEEQGERDLTVDDLRTIARLEVEKERTINRINLGAREAIRNNPVLDKDSDQYDADVNEAVTTAVFNEIRLDPTKDVEKLTEKYMKPYRKAAGIAVLAEKATLAKQANDTLIRPTNVKANGKSFNELSIEEMEAKLGITY